MILDERLALVTAAGRESAALFDAIIGDPILTSTIDGASTLAVTISDPDRDFLAQVDSPREVKKAYAVVDGDQRFALAHVGKRGHRLILTYEDAVISALRAQTGRITLKAGSTSLGAFIRRLAREAGVKVDVDPKADEIPAARLLGRSLGARTTNSWQVLCDIARREGWRCFSDGTQIVIGSDAWLLDRGAPWEAQEFVHPVGVVDFDVLPNATTHSSTLYVDTPAWKARAGDAVDVSGAGPADGLWIQAKWRRGLLEEGETGVSLIQAGTAAGLGAGFDDKSSHRPQGIDYDPMTAVVTQVHGGEVYAVPIGGNHAHPFGPCHGVKTKHHKFTAVTGVGGDIASVTSSEPKAMRQVPLQAGDTVLLVMTPQGPWITAVDE